MSADFPVTIRPADIADVPALAKLGAATFTATFGHLYASEDLARFLSSARSEAAYHELMRDSDVYIALAVSHQDQAIGYCVAGKCKLPVADLERRAGEIRELYVLADFQKHKISTLLLADSLAWLKRHVFSPLYVGVWSQNFGAQRLYGRLGFEKVGEYDFPVGRHLDHEYILKRSNTVF